MADEDAKEVELEVVSYDPIRRKGFMRIVSEAAFGGARVHFALAMLPEESKRPVIEASRELNRLMKTGQDAGTVLGQLKLMMHGARFRALVRRGDDGRHVMLRRSISLVGPDVTPG